MVMGKILRVFSGRDLWTGRMCVAVLSSLALLLWFDVDWCITTTFRAMSDPLMWLNTLVAALLMSIPYAAARRISVHVIWLTVVYGLLEANLMYCRTYLTAIPPASYLLVGNLSDFTASVTDSIRWYDWFGALTVVAAGWVMKRKAALRPRRPVVRILLLSAVMASVSALWIMARGGFYAAYDRLAQSCYYSTCGVPVYTVGGHIAYSLIDDSRRDATDHTPDIDRWIALHDSLVAVPELPADAVPRRNLVLIICESLESWPVEARIDGKEITPYLNSLLRDSTTLYAPNILTQVASGRSIDCQLLINCGLLPMNGQVYSMKYPSVTYPSLNKAMRERYGTKSYIFTCDKPITWNQQAIGRAFGYDSLIDRRAWRMDEMIGNPAKLSDGSFLRQSVELLRQGHIWPEGESRMLTFVTYSGHNPFRLPDNMVDPQFDMREKDLPRRLADYIAMAHYTDSQLHILIDYLRSRRDFDNTLVVIVGDHEGLAGDRNDFVKASSLVSAGQYTPLLILNPPAGGGSRVESVAGQIDIYPTLSAMLGLSGYFWHGMGQSLLDPDRGAYAVSMMTGEEVGDSAALTSRMLDMIRSARRISDATIRSDYFKNQPLNGSD